MAKQITITSVCDNKSVHGDNQVPANHEHLIVVDGEARQVDTCDTCEARIIEAVVLDLMTHGAVPEYTPAPKRTHRGQSLPTVCPLDGTKSKSRAGLGQHLKQHHSQTFSNFPGGLKSAADYEGLAYGPTDR